MKLSVENKNVLLVEKPVGKTPLQVIRALQKEKPSLVGKKIGYAGRLDPMAEGLLLLLVGEENKKRKLYEDLPKTYKFSLLLGVETDTYDILGKIMGKGISGIILSKQQIEKEALALIGKKIVEYPPYSSAVYKGKPLYYWARKGLLSTITFPKRNREIFSLGILKIRAVSGHTLKEYVCSRIKLVEGDFRQGEIIMGWEDQLGKGAEEFQIVDFRIVCSSGTYVRSVCNELGKKLKTCGIALSIQRTRIGTYRLKDAPFVNAQHNL